MVSSRSAAGTTGTGRPPSFPKAILSVSREEFYGQDEAHQPLKLTVKKGLTEEMAEIPAELGLYGSVFVVGPVGNAASTPVDKSAGDRVVLPSDNGWTPLLAGDGMVYRLDFETSGDRCQPYLASRIVATPSILADEITAPETIDGKPNPYHKFRFVNLGLVRMSPFLGASNQLNTAFLPLLSPTEKYPRLLVTWDVGRPFEIDPDSLAVLAPIGLNTDWQPMIPGSGFLPFAQLMSSAHPCCDPNRGEMFTANVVKSLSTISLLDRLARHLWGPATSNISVFFAIPVKIVAGMLFGVAWVAESILQFFQNVLGWGKDAIYLVGSKGTNRLKKWKLTHNDRSIKIFSTCHQMGITRNHILLAETVFKFALEDLIPVVSKTREAMPGQDSDDLDKGLEGLHKKLVDFYRGLVTFPQSRKVKMYIIDRQKLDFDRGNGTGEVPVRSVEIDGEFNHFLTDYDDGNGKITIHPALNAATDSAEFVHQADEAMFEDANPSAYKGSLPNGMSINQNSLYVIDSKTGAIEKQAMLPAEQAKQFAWYVAIYAYRDDFPTQRFSDIYWIGFGAWKDLQTQFMYDLYKSDKYRQYRQMPLDEFMEMTRAGVPSTLYRVRIDRNSPSALEVADAYKAPFKYFLSSPQFVPRQNSQGSTEGYIVCTAIYSDHLLSDVAGQPNWSANSELWIFDAANLSSGPIYRLSHPKLNFTFTVHSTWLSDRHSTPRPEYDIRQDFQDVVAKRAALFKKEETRQRFYELFDLIYERFDRNR